MVIALGKIGEELDEDVFLFPHILHAPNNEFGRGDVEGIPARIAEAEFFESVAIHPQVAPTAEEFVLLHGKEDTIPVKKPHGLGNEFGGLARVRGLGR